MSRIGQPVKTTIIAANATSYIFVPLWPSSPQPLLPFEHLDWPGSHAKTLARSQCTSPGGTERIGIPVAFLCSFGHWYDPDQETMR